MYKLVFICLIVCAGASATATEHNQVAQLDVTCNAHGAIIKPREGPYAGSTFYLGKDGDAAQPGVGEGRWWTAASGYIVQINGNAIRFNGDVPCF